MFEERDDKGGLMHRRRFSASGDADNSLSEDRGDNGRKGGGGAASSAPSLGPPASPGGGAAASSCGGAAFRDTQAE